MLSRHSSFIVFGFLLAACSSAGSDDSGSNEGATVATPVGSDTTGAISVLVPSATLPILSAHFVAGGSAAPAGGTIDQVPVGLQNVQLKAGASTDPISGFTMSQFKVEPRKTTTIPAALVGFDMISGPPTLGLGKLVTRRPPIFDNDITIARTEDGKTLTPVLPGHYELHFGLANLDGVPVALAGGETKSIVATDASARRVARVHAGQRDLPTANCGASGDPDAWVIRARRPRDMTYQEVMPLTLASGQSIDLGVSPSNEGASYTIAASAWTTDWTIPLGERGAVAESNLGRIDVSDVQEAGKTVKGTYNIYPSDAQGAHAGGPLLRCSPQTGTGVDVPPGTYAVEVTYNTVDAGAKTVTNVVTTHQ